MFILQFIEGALCVSEFYIADLCLNHFYINFFFFFTQWVRQVSYSVPLSQSDICVLSVRHPHIPSSCYPQLHGFPCPFPSPFHLSASQGN